MRVLSGRKRKYAAAGVKNIGKGDSLGSIRRDENSRRTTRGGAKIKEQGTGKRKNWPFSVIRSTAPGRLWGTLQYRKETGAIPGLTDFEWGGKRF